MSARSVIIMDENRTPATVDDLAGHLVVIDSVHHRVHMGQMFSCSIFDGALGAAASAELLIRVPANAGAHLSARGALGGDAVGRMFEAPTTTDDGTAVPRLNRNRRSATVADLLVFTGPTVTIDGTELLVAFIPGGTGGNALGGQGETFGEWILDESTDYLLRVTNLTGQVQPVSIEINWYEPGPPVTQET